MVKNKKVARKLHDALIRSRADLNQVLDDILHDLSEEELFACRHAIGTMIAEIQLEGLEPLYAVHPELRAWSR